MRPERLSSVSSLFMAVHSVPFSGGAFTGRLDAGLVSASTLLLKNFIRVDIASHDPNTLVLSRHIVCRSAPAHGLVIGLYQRGCAYSRRRRVSHKPCVT